MDTTTKNTSGPIAEALLRKARKQAFTFVLDGREIDARVVDGELRLSGDGTLCIQPRAGNAVSITLV